MRVILTADVYKHGVAGEVIDVADGYARNYLIPQELAIKATPGAMKQADKLRREAAARRARVYNEMEGVAKLVEETELRFPVKAGTTGKLYGSVTMSEIADQLQERIGLDIDRRRIGEGNSLRELGAHAVPVRLVPPDLVPRVTVLIYREGESPEELAAEAEAEAAAAEAAAAEADIANEADEADEAAQISDPGDSMKAEADDPVEAEE